MSVLGILAWVFTLLLVLLVVACIAGARGSLPRNHLFGIRLPALQVSDDAWRAGHFAAAIPACVALASALMCSLIGLLTAEAYFGTIFAFVGGVIWVMIIATRAAKSVETPR